MTHTRVTFTVLAILAANVLSAEDRIRAGLWEDTVTSGGKSVSKSHCITSDAASKMNASVKTLREETEQAMAKSGKCTLKDFSVEGNKLTFSMVCGATSFDHTTIYRGDSFETTSTATSAAGSQVTLIKGRRLSACP